MFALTEILSPNRGTVYSFFNHKLFNHRKKKVFLPNKLARYPIPNHIKNCLMNLDGDIELLVPELAQVKIEL